jgi:phytol kinase
LDFAKNDLFGDNTFMITAAILAVLVVFVLLLASEYMWRIKHYRSEVTRKFAHITIGTFVAFWPFFLSWRTIEWLSLAFLIVVSISKVLTIFRSIHSIERKTSGEALFAVGVGIIAFITHEPWVFFVSILHLSLADGLAAIIGTKYGKHGRYNVFGHTKSQVGSATFWLVSATILGFFVALHGPHNLWPIVILLPPLATFVENVGIQGTDNILVPLVVAVILRLLI